MKKSGVRRGVLVYKGPDPAGKMEIPVDGLSCHLGGEFDFRVVAYDRDSGDSLPYPELKVAEWNDVNDQAVYYVPRSGRRWLGMARLLRTEDFDLLYIQSLFNPCFSLWPLLLRRFGLLRSRKVLLAPRGELSPGALGIRPIRKRLMIRLLRWLGMCRGVHWQATSKEEVKEINHWRVRHLGRRGELPQVFLAPNLQRVASPATEPAEGVVGDGPVRVVFLSRIAPMKNLDFALEVLRRVRVNVRFSIYGPIDRTPNYWNSCLQIIHRLPKNVRVTYEGSILPHQVHHLFGEQELLFLPTRGESFGHVILEAMLGGCPVLISDQTPWRGLEERRVGWDLPLNRPERFVQAIEMFAQLTAEGRHEMRLAASRVGREFLDLEHTVPANRAMLDAVGRADSDRA